MKTSAMFVCALALGSCFAKDPARPGNGAFEYRVLATSKTSTMEKELNEAAAQGYSFASAMGGQTANAGKEVVIVMSKRAGQSGPGKQYKLLATSKTSTMEKELQAAGDQGFDYCGQTVFESAFGGKEVSVILERDPAAPKRQIQFRLLATTKTSTMEKELNEAGAAEFEFMNVMVGQTAFGGKEVVSILRKYVE